MSITGPADLRDQQRLAECIANANAGTEMLVGAVNEIRSNWTEGRNFSRLHPGISAEDYIKREVPALRGNTAAAVALVEAGVTTARDAGRLAGVAHTTVTRRLVQDAPIAKPTTLATGRTAPGPAIGTRVVREVVAEIMEDDLPISPPPPLRVLIQSFERDLRSLRDGYLDCRSQEKFERRFGSVFAAIDDALGGTEK